MTIVGYMGFVVYRVTCLGQDGNRGVDYKRIAVFPTKEKAEEYVNAQTDTNGWVSYKIREE